MVRRNGERDQQTLGETSLFSTSELFHENSKQTRYNLEYGRRIQYVNQNPAIHSVSARAFKHYRGLTTVTLTRDFPDATMSFDETILKRRSFRDYSGDPLTLAQVAKLLYFGNGITGKQEGQVTQFLRASPSAGALYPIEFYFVALHVDDLAQGTYHYNVREHLLEMTAAGDFRAKLIEFASYEALFGTAAGAVILTGVFSRTKFKYGERGYRFVLLEAGHTAQNILLTAASLGLGAVPIGGFFDDAVNQMLDIDGIDEAALYILAVGR
jgi:SagB-type dehydrogenase family enzyme